MFRVLVIFSITFLVFMIIRINTYSNAEHVKGRVVDIREHQAVNFRGGRAGWYKVPIISFRYYDSTYCTKDDEGVDYITALNEGDSAWVMFPTSKPQEAKLYSFWIYWFNITAIGIWIISSLILIGVVQIFSMPVETYDE